MKNNQDIENILEKEIGKRLIEDGFRKQGNTYCKEMSDIHTRIYVDFGNYSIRLEKEHEE